MIRELASIRFDTRFRGRSLAARRVHQPTQVPSIGSDASSPALTGLLALATIAVTSIAFGCASTGTPSDANTTPGRGAAQPIRAPSQAALDAATPFAGSCAFARPPEDDLNYPIPLTTSTKTAVFSTANFGAGETDHIGSIEADQSVRASGPIASGADSSPGFAVLLVDTNGRVCRGYIDAATATVATPDK